jgi:hypothetical protein
MSTSGTVSPPVLQMSPPWVSWGGWCPELHSLWCQSLISGTGSFLLKPSVFNHHAVISASQSIRKMSGFFSPHPQPKEYWKSMNYKTPGCPQPLGGGWVSGVEVAVGRTPKGLSESQASEPPLCTRPAPLLPSTATVPLSRSTGPQVFCTRLSFRRKCN